MLRVENRLTRCVLLSALAFALVAVPVAAGGADRGAGSLALQVALRVEGGHQLVCPPNAPPEADICVVFTGNGLVPGLGAVRESYVYFADENPSGCVGVSMLHMTGQIDVFAKGAIQFELAGADQCFPDYLKTRQTFTITDGSGPYVGATGAGTLDRDLHIEGAAVGTDTWSGSLAVQGLEFDVTPPTLSGLVNRTVRARKGAKRARVKYRVTARDLVDGSLPARCQPGSGTWFRVGRRTVVKCSATDKSANTAAGAFRVVVKRGR